MINEKLFELINIVLVKTQEKKAIWEKGSATSQFKLSFSDGTALFVDEYSRNYQNPVYSVDVYNKKAELIKSYNTATLATTHDTYKLLKLLHEVASDEYYNVEETIDELINSAKSEDVIGKEEQEFPWD